MSTKRLVIAIVVVSILLLGALYEVHQGNRELEPLLAGSSDVRE